MSYNNFVLNDLKKGLTSLKLLTFLISIAVIIYLLQFLFDILRGFSDIIWVFILGWLVSFILEPFVDIFTKYLKLSRPLATTSVFVLSAVLIIVVFVIFVPNIVSHFNALGQVIPQFLERSPPLVQRVFENFINSLNTSSDLIPSVTQFLINLVVVLILSFYLVLEKENLNKKVFRITPTKYHETIRFVQRVIDQSFASFVRVQVFWGVLGGIITFIVLKIFDVSFASSTSILAGVLTAVPVIGPIIGVFPPLLIALVDKPDQAIIIFLIIFVVQQFIFNVFGPKIIGRVFNINPILVILSLLIGIKVAGAIGAVLAIPVISILIIFGQELYTYYFKEKETRPQ